MTRLGDREVKKRAYLALRSNQRPLKWGTGWTGEEVLMSLEISQCYRNPLVAKDPPNQHITSTAIQQANEENKCRVKSSNNFIQWCNIQPFIKGQMDGRIHVWSVMHASLLLIWYSPGHSCARTQGDFISKRTGITSKGTDTTAHQFKEMNILWFWMHNQIRVPSLKCYAKYIRGRGRPSFHPERYDSQPPPTDEQVGCVGSKCVTKIYPSITEQHKTHRATRTSK